MIYQEDAKHTFAFYWPELSHSLSLVHQGSSFALDDPQLTHRIIHVLRLKANDICTLFDGLVYAHVHIDTVHKKYIIIHAIGVFPIKKQKPEILFFLPLLKRDSLDEAVYGLVETGASKIYLTQTTKTQRTWQGDRELSRLKAISISAAEQSKNFELPSIEKPMQLIELLKNNVREKTNLIFFHPQGQRLYDYFDSEIIAQDSPFVLVIGPEGDLTTEEKVLLKSYNAHFIRLTHTVLRAQQAAICASASIRSFV